MVNSLLIACYEWFCVFEPLEMSILYNLWHFLAFNMKNENEISLKWAQILFIKYIQGIFTYSTSLNNYFTTFWILYLIIFFWTPLKSRFWPCSFRPTVKKIGPIENYHFFFISEHIVLWENAGTGFAYFW